MESKFYEWAPLKDENLLLLRTDLNKMVLSNAVGIPLIAFLQGVVGLIGYLLIGVPEPLFWFVITAFTALLPVVGSSTCLYSVSIIVICQW
jgi:predicted PurR-regulated permease PerM